MAKEDLQYGDWLLASPLKSHRRNAEAAIKEEAKLFLVFGRIGKGVRPDNGSPLVMDECLRPHLLLHPLTKDLMVDQIK